MLDPAFVRDNPETVRAGYANRGLDAQAELEQLAGLDAERRRLIPDIEGLKREQNAAAAADVRAGKAPKRRRATTDGA